MLLLPLQMLPGKFLLSSTIKKGRSLERPFLLAQKTIGSLIHDSRAVLIQGWHWITHQAIETRPLDAPKFVQ